MDGTEEFVIIRARFDGGGYGHGPHDVFPHGWHVYAHKLNEDGSYNPDGQRVDFWMTGCFGEQYMIRKEEVKVLRKMRRVVDFVSVEGEVD